jgi:hypothetical protein
MAAAPAAEFLQRQALGRLLLVLGRDVVPALAFRARQGDVVSHDECLVRGADDRDRTGDLVLTKDVLCQLSYIGPCYSILERETGIEPATNSLEGCDSTTELLPQAASRRPRAVGEQKALVARQGFEPWKALGRQIYSLLHLTALQSRQSCLLIVWTEESASATRADLGAGEGI